VLALGQTFDVASIKPAEQAMNGMVRIGMSGGPGTPDPGRITYSGVPLFMVLSNAFNVKQYQISGPGEVLSQRFDITAKVPAGATKEDVQVMMQNLLAERFKMTFHREKKEMASYVLTVSPKGSKLKPADPEPKVDPDAPPPPPPGPGRMNGPLKMGKDGFPELPKGGRGGGPMMIMMNGKAKMECASCPIARLADTLSNQLGKPIVDMTGLTGNFTFTLFFEPDMAGMAMKAGLAPPPPPPPGAGPGGASPPEASLDTAPPLLSAIQDQLGLKLEPKKAPVELIVIDHMEKTPTDN
jgi:uncharacterized protein (TIGR03435 family)